MSVLPEAYRIGPAGDAYDDPPLIHVPCGTVVCTIEHGDDLSVLVGTALDHRCPAIPKGPIA
ncbi:hypothetical protein [Actinomadura violacea]|uniref:Uncharacterized protein n=1 Tax=Actinomadura violacea TaxID=2819934 RepID=A0ABS3RY75_9ACTN|nr:hypothetical protein [Actinomadura violacea]MBO2461714.1 hypothetical protein [Actinomadura violacea]